MKQLSAEQLLTNLPSFPSSSLPNLYKHIRALRLLKEEEAAERAKESLRHFVRQSWRYVDPGSYIHNWHIDAISDHLQAVNEGHIKRLLINIPPRGMKSILGAVDWPAWTWIQDRDKGLILSGPQVRFLFASYALSLSVRDSVKCRRLIESPWYQENFGDNFQITSDQNTKIRFENDKGGYRLATSVDGTATGEGGDIVVADDPHNVQGGESDVQRQATLDWWDGTMSTRLNDPKTGAYVVVKQRIHEKDLSGHILAKNHKEYDHLCLPMEYEPKHIYPVRSSIGFKDPRKEEGELLWPARIGGKEVERLKISLAARAVGQLQQRPSHDDGNIYKRSHWREWKPERPPPIDFVIQIYDTAFEEKEENDPSACITWGIFHIKDAEKRLIPQLIMIDAWDERLSFPELRERAINDNEKYEPDVILIEKKSSGHSLLQELRRAGLPVRAFDPKNRSKTFRASIASVVPASNCVWAPMRQTVHEDGAVSYDWRSFAERVIDQCAKFPNDEHDEYADICSMAFLYVRRRFWLGLDVESDDIDYISEMKGERFYG